MLVDIITAKVTGNYTLFLQFEDALKDRWTYRLLFPLKEFLKN